MKYSYDFKRASTVSILRHLRSKFNNKKNQTVSCIVIAVFPRNDRVVEMLPFLKFDYNYYYIHRYLTGTKELYLAKYMQYKKINKILMYW